MLALDTTLVAEQEECSKTRCGPHGKGSRCGVVRGGLGACRHGQKTLAEKSGHSTSGILGAGQEVTWDHPEGQRPSAWVKGTTGDRGPAGGLCRAHHRASFNHLPGHPTEASCRPKGLRPPSHVRTILLPYLSFWASFQAWRKTAASQGEEVSRGRGEERTMPLSQGRLPARGRSEPREKRRCKAKSVSEF